MKKFKNSWGKGFLKGRLEINKKELGCIEFWEKYTESWVNQY